MEPFGQVAAFTLADAVEKRIYEYISQNDMKPGDLLPKEEELAKALNVSRNILREALSRLRMLGLVESRKKKGMIVTQPSSFTGLERLVSMGVIDNLSKKELIEMRIIIELGLIDYIFHRKTPKDIEELEFIIAKEDSRKLTLQKENEIDIAFHSKLYEISGNEVIVRFQSILKPFFSEIEKNIRKYNRSTPPTHKEICKILRNGTIEEFREVMHKHLKMYVNF